MAQFKFQINLPCALIATPTKLTMTDDADYCRFMDQLLFTRDDLTSEEHAKLIYKKNQAMKNGEKCNMTSPIMKMKFDIESSVAETSKKKENRHQRQYITDIHLCGIQNVCIRKEGIG